jgi:hypothetical protein
MPAACQALEVWAGVAALKPGQPVFRPVDQRQIIAEERLTDRSVARIVKGRVRKLARLRGRSETAPQLGEPPVLHVNDEYADLGRIATRSG